MGKMLAGVRLGEQKEEMVQKILRNAVFKTREVKPFIVCTHLLGMGPDELLEKAKKENCKKKKLLKKANVKRKPVISLSQEEMTEGNIT